MPIDHTSFSKDAKPSNAPNDKRWWLADISGRAQAVFYVVTQIIQNDSSRLQQARKNVRLYGNSSQMGLPSISLAKTQSGGSTRSERVTYNVISAVIETVCAKLAKNKPKPMFLTSGGNYKQQRKAKKLDSFVEGVFYENDAQGLKNVVTKDAAAQGDGFAYVFESNERVAYERAMNDELFVDWLESYYGNPRQLHRVKQIDRMVLAETFPDHRDAILEAKGSADTESVTAQNVADQITVVESWHLPSGPNAKDGLHSINMEGTNLLDEEWEEDFFPFAKLQWASPLYGYWSQGVPQRIGSIQLEINKILWVIQRSMHLMGSFKIWLKTGTKTPKEHFNNELGTVLTGEEPPQYLTPNAVPGEYYSHLTTLKNAAFEQEGVSQLSAISQKPAGLDSGKALREYNDIESDRFQVLGQEVEKFMLSLGKLTVWKAKEIAKRKGGYKVKVPGKNLFQEIDWKDVGLKDEEFVMKMYPVSSLPNDPSGRLSTIQEYIQAGFIQPRVGQRLLDLPDLEANENLANAMQDRIHQAFEKIIDDGEFTPPDPKMDLALSREIALEYYNYAASNGVEDDKLEMIDQFLSQIDALQAQAMPPAPMGMPGGAPGAPQAAPMAPPQSDLIPNAPGAA